LTFDVKSFILKNTMTQKQILTKKEKALDLFTHHLFQSRQGKLIKRVILHGSLAKGIADEESDIDVLIFANKPNEVERKAEDIAFNIMLKKGEYIEPFVYPAKEFEKPSSYFIYHAITSGRQIVPYGNRESRWA